MLKKIEITLDEKIYTAYPCERIFDDYIEITSISKNEIEKSKYFSCCYVGNTDEDFIIYNENNLGFYISEEEIKKGYKTYLSQKGMYRIQRLLKDMLVDKLISIKKGDK